DLAISAPHLLSAPLVIAGLDPAIHVCASRAGIPGSSPGMTGDGMDLSAQLCAGVVAGQENVRPQRHRQYQRAVRRPRGMAIALRSPDIIAGGDLAFLVDKAAFENKGLFDLDMLVQ